MVVNVDWEGACTFDEYVISLFEEKKTSTEEFQLIMRVYGRERLEKLWKEYKINGKRNEPSRD